VVDAGINAVLNFYAFGFGFAGLYIFIEAFGVVPVLIFLAGSATTVLAAIKTLYYWHALNRYLVKANMLRLFTDVNNDYRVITVETSATLWVMIQFFAIIGIVAVGKLFVDSWRQYRTKMATFDARREKKIQ
jgi:hypothetical protein